MTKLLSYLSAALFLAIKVAFLPIRPSKGASSRRTGPGRPAAARNQSASRPTLRQAPLTFEPNRGQTDTHVQWVARGPQYALFLTGHDAVLEINQVTPLDKKATPALPSIAISAVRMHLLGASNTPTSTGEQHSPAPRIT
jgi:hypothetical protein